MNKLIAVLMLCLSFNALAGYKGQDPSEKYKTVDSEGGVYRLFDNKPTDAQALKAPFCADRKMMTRTLPDGRYELGCWWMIGELYFAYTVHRGIMGFNPDFVLHNDNYTAERSHYLRY